MQKVSNINHALGNVEAAEARLSAAQSDLNLTKPLYYAARSECHKNTTDETIRIRGEAYICYHKSITEMLAAKDFLKAAREAARLFTYNQKPCLTRSGHALRR